MCFILNFAKLSACKGFRRIEARGQRRGRHVLWHTFLPLYHTEEIIFCYIQNDTHSKSYNFAQHYLFNFLYLCTSTSEFHLTVQPYIFTHQPTPYSRNLLIMNNIQC